MEVLITSQDEFMMTEYFQCATFLRSFNIVTSVFLEKQPLVNQLKFASKKLIKFVVICNRNEHESGKPILRDMENGTQISAFIKDLPNLILETSK